MTQADAILSARELRVVFDDDAGELCAVDGASFDLIRGRTLALVGESGCGKTVTALALLALIDPPGRIAGGSIRYCDQELIGADEQTLCRIRGHRIAMIFQEPMTALNPVLRVGEQVAEPLLVHKRMSHADARAATIELLGEVGISSPAQRYDCYPHELSGGMRQRILVAMALACTPEVIVADEPTTAVDVTIQAQILALVRRLQRERDMALLFITHDLALVEAIADEVAVMYAGRIVEHRPAADIVTHPRHPYARALWRASPSFSPPGEPLHAIAGSVPNLRHLPAGCAFFDRCPRRDDRCQAERPPLDDGVACFFPESESLKP